MTSQESLQGVWTHSRAKRTPLEWFIDRYRIARDKKSGIVNNPNGWFGDPRELIEVVCRIVHVSVESTHIVKALPEPIAIESDSD